MADDIRYALRTLARTPLFTAGAIATLALGIGVNSTIFTVTSALLLRPLPGIVEPDRVAWISSASQPGGRSQGLSFPDYADIREHARGAFDDLLGFRPTFLSLGSGGDPTRIHGHLVTGSYFRVLGVRPALGRGLDETDDQPGAGRRVAVISDRLWRQRFGGTPAALNRSITLNGRPFTIVGIAPPSFHGPALGEPGDAWIPIQLWPELHASEPDLLTDRGAAWLMSMGRLKPGASLREANAALTVLSHRLAQSYPGTNGDRTMRASAPGSAMSPGARGEMIPLSALLLGLAALVLLTACANIANLLLARGAARAPELSVRAALGASRGRLVKQLLAESGVLAGAGALAAILLSFWGADLLVSYLPADEFDGLVPGTDTRLLAFTALLAAASVCAFGLLPALTVTRRSLVAVSRDIRGGRTRLQGAFVVAQLSLSLVLLLGAGMSVRQLQHAARVDLGFDPRHVVTVSYDLALQNYPTARREAFRRELLREVRAVPGVIDAGITNVPPLGGLVIGLAAATIEEPDAQRMTYSSAVGAGYFATMKIPVLRGRAIDNRDGAGAPAVAVVNETLAERLWPGVDAVGRELRANDWTLQVIGVARDSKYDEAAETPRPFVYTAIEQHAVVDQETLLVRSTAGAAVAAEVTAVVRRLDPALPVFNVQPLEAMLVQRLDKERAVSALVAAFGLLALLLAALGLYGVVGYTVTRRQREIGVRLALGATPGQVVRLVAADGLRLALGGVAIGSLLSLPLAKLLGAFVFGMRVGDVAGFLMTCALLVAVALIAASLPARRAGRLDPMAALRAD